MAEIKLKWQEIKNEAQRIFDSVGDLVELEKLGAVGGLIVFGALANVSNFGTTWLVSAAVILLVAVPLYLSLKKV